MVGGLAVGATELVAPAVDGYCQGSMRTYIRLSRSAALISRYGVVRQQRFRIWNQMTETSALTLASEARPATCV